MTDATLTGVFGRRGMGKSTRIKELIRGRPRVIVFDPMNEYHREGFMPIPWAAIPQFLSRPSFQVAYVPRKGHAKRALDGICKHLLERFDGQGGRGAHTTLVVEEISLSFPSEKLPDDLWGMPSMCEQGRHAGVDVIAATQRPARVSTIFRGNCEATYIFGLSDYTDVKAVCERIGPEWRDRLRALERHHYLLYRDAKVTEGENLLNS